MMSWSLHMVFVLHLIMIRLYLQNWPKMYDVPRIVVWNLEKMYLHAEFIVQQNLIFQEPVTYLELQWHLETLLLILSWIWQQWNHGLFTVLLIIILMTCYLSYVLLTRHHCYALVGQLACFTGSHILVTLSTDFTHVSGFMISAIITCMFLVIISTVTPYTSNILKTLPALYCLTIYSIVSVYRGPIAIKALTSSIAFSLLLIGTFTFYVYDICYGGILGYRDIITWSSLACF